jgi:DNA-binding transcriptional ArsR family regulator
LDNEIRLNRTAAKIYLYLVKRRESVGVRDIARELKLPPSTVYYNLKKLEELGLVQRDGDGYSVKKLLKPDEIIIIKGVFIHRLTMYSFFFLGTALGFIVISILHGANIDRVLATVSSLIAFTILFLEGLKQVKQYT